MHIHKLIGNRVGTGLVHPHDETADSALVRKQEESACAVPGHEFSGVITAIGKDVQDFEIGDEVYGMNDWFADGANAEFCITLPQNIGTVRATEQK